ncbi:transient receptor potential cation channel subfamily a member 1-like [Gigaspora margarita]|uniref:Transient receptor potential cation channel subfamily a member 1-like n=1 Tax=Gigaspora margarita TaxID=4874 RepID=A0A8H4B299_GIGMA|nr:transient receptor potential cation channel subfamily a member 1-like [Gigaspora margarita]
MLSFLIAATIKGLSSNIQSLLLTMTIILGILHLIFEIRQFIYSPISWITDIWNYFDIGAILFPIITSLNWLQSSTASIWAITVSILLLELKFITFFRAIKFGGTHWAMIIRVIQNSLSFFVIIGFIIFAFAHSLYVLLRSTTDAINNSNDSKELNTNMFMNLNTAFLATYMMLIGDLSSISNWSLTENLTLTILIVLFSFFTTIYLMNLFIGLLSNFISETNKKELFLLQRAKILSEIELFYMLPYQRRKNNWFPEIIFYRFSLDKFYEIAYKVQNNSWDNTLEKPFLPNTLLKIVHLYEDKDGLSQKLEIIKIEIIQELTNDEKKIIQKLNNKNIVQELKKILLKEID